ncbi:unnamed protein product [Rotaria sp. Silwood2]|nr:unnamed protein product [Rotaria sp. Silwood2]
MSLIAHVDHGKSILTYLLVYNVGIIVQQRPDEIRLTDTPYLLWIVKKGEYMQLLEKLYIRLQDYDRDKLEEVGDSLLKLVMQQSLSAGDILLTIIAIHLTSSIVAQ